MPTIPNLIKRCKVCKAPIPLSQQYCREHQEIIKEREKQENEK